MVDDQYRGLLTEREREILKGEADVSDNYRYRVVSRIRTKIENVDEDVEILSEEREDLLEELRESVCEDRL
jgi:non-homologous end joining protein Ku